MRNQEISSDVYRYVYGDIPLNCLDFFFTEETSIHISAPYSNSKTGADLLVRTYHRTYGMPAIISHCSHNYRPYYSPKKLIPFMTVKPIVDKILPVYGKYLNIHEWLYVEERYKAIDLSIHNGRVGDNVAGYDKK